MYLQSIYSRPLLQRGVCSLVECNMTSSISAAISCGFRASVDKFVIFVHMYHGQDVRESFLYIIQDGYHIFPIAISDYVDTWYRHLASLSSLLRFTLYRLISYVLTLSPECSTQRQIFHCKLRHQCYRSAHTLQYAHNMPWCQRTQSLSFAHFSWSVRIQFYWITFRVNHAWIEVGFDDFLVKAGSQ